jgi:chromosome segregation ATPase
MEISEQNKDLEREKFKLKKQVKNGGGSNRRDDDDDDEPDMDALENQMQILQDHLNEEKVKTAKYQEDIDELKSNVKTLKSGKLEAEAASRQYQKDLSKLQDETLDSANKSRNLDAQTKELNKQKSQTVKESKRLYEENSTLQQENNELNEKIRELDEKQGIFEELIAKLADEKDDLEAQVDTSDFAKDELQTRINELEYSLEKLHEQLHVAAEVETEWQNQVTTLKHDFSVKSNKLTSDLDKLNVENNRMKKEISILKDSTLVGEKQREIDALKLDQKENITLLDEMRKETEIAINDKVQLAERCLFLETNIDQQVAEKTVEVKKKLKDIERLLVERTTNHKEELARVEELEKEKDLLLHDNTDLQRWKIEYENGHGLRALAKNMDKLKRDNRHIGIVVEQTASSLGKALDANNILTQAFTKLKLESGKPEDFMYDEYQLHEEMKSDNARINSQNLELENQITSLEEDNTRLRKALKNQAGSIGENGFKYSGMDAQMLVKVNEFASNLRNGIEVPILDNRSQELYDKNRKLEKQIQSLEEDLERANFDLKNMKFNEDGESLGVHRSAKDEPPVSSLSKVHEAELFGLREDMHRLLNENGDLHDRLTSMQGKN